MTNKRRNAKYNNKKTGVYDSKAEARRGAELELLLHLGEIIALKRQVVFILVPDQFETLPPKTPRSKPKQVLVERKSYYVADFTYFTTAGEYIVEDVKGVKTALYVLKRKLMLHIHSIRVREVACTSRSSSRKSRNSKAK